MGKKVVFIILLIICLYLYFQYRFFYLTEYEYILNYPKYKGRFTPILSNDALKAASFLLYNGEKLNWYSICLFTSLDINLNKGFSELFFKIWYCKNFLPRNFWSYNFFIFMESVEYEGIMDSCLKFFNKIFLFDKKIFVADHMLNSNVCDRVMSYFLKNISLERGFAVPIYNRFILNILEHCR